MRRLVVNPYVMDIDMITNTCAPLRDRKYRRAIRRYLAELLSFMPPEKITCPILAIWGDHDLLYPISISSDIHNRYPQTKRLDIEGGKLLHPIERPWAFADTLHAQLSEIHC